jgi:hypothetical protein
MKKDAFYRSHARSDRRKEHIAFHFPPIARSYGGAGDNPGEKINSAIV